MKISIYTDKIEYKEDGHNYIIIETFRPSSVDEKQILINALIEVTGFVQTEF